MHITSENLDCCIVTLFVHNVCNYTCSYCSDYHRDGTSRWPEDWKAYLDLIEKLNLLVSSNGSVLNSEINGFVRMKSLLSGMPELKPGLNDKLMFEMTGRNYSRGKAVMLEDIKFH